MTLRQEIKPLSGNRRRFLLLRITDMDTSPALKLVGVKLSTYHSWLQNREFKTLYRRRKEFATDYKQEAIQLLRRDNQLEAVLLEGKVIAQMKIELESGEYSLIRSHLAREVYSKLMADLDIQPTVQLTWEQRLEHIIKPDELEEGQAMEGEFVELEETSEVSSD